MRLAVRRTGWHECFLCATRCPRNRGRAHEKNNVVRRAGPAHHRMVQLAALGTSLLAGFSCQSSRRASDRSAILQQLRSFNTMGSVLYIAAHPDDENTQVITYLARRPRIPDGLSLAYPRRRRAEPARPPTRRRAGRGAHAGAARRTPAGRRAAVLHRAKDFGYSKNSRRR